MPTPQPSSSPSYDKEPAPPPSDDLSTSIATNTTLTATESQSGLPYSSSVSGAILSHLLSTFVTPATNYVHISDSNNSVKGSWTISTDLSPPTALLAAVEGSERKNLYVHTKSGSLNAKVRLSSPPDAVHERATFHFSSQNGDIQVYIVSFTGSIAPHVIHINGAADFNLSFHARTSLSI